MSVTIWVALSLSDSVVFSAPGAQGLETVFPFQLNFIVPEVLISRKAGPCTSLIMNLT